MLNADLNPGVIIKQKQTEGKLSIFDSGIDEFNKLLNQILVLDVMDIEKEKNIVNNMLSLNLPIELLSQLSESDIILNGNTVKLVNDIIDKIKNTIK